MSLFKKLRDKLLDEIELFMKAEGLASIISQQEKVSISSLYVYAVLRSIENNNVKAINIGIANLIANYQKLYSEKNSTAI